MTYTEKRDAYLAQGAIHADKTKTVRQNEKFKIDEGDGFPSWLRVGQFMKTVSRA